VKILLIEDDIDIATSIAQYLEYQSMSVDFAYSAHQAKSVLAHTTFDLIIMDVNLPDGNGIALCRDLKRQHNIKQPILFLTARGMLEDKLEAFESGALDYMVKPFSMQELCARIKAISSHTYSQEQYEMSLGALSVCAHTATVKYDSHHIQLNTIGLKLLLALMRSYPKPLSSDRLCSMIWENEVPKSNPLKAHISRVNSQFMNCSQQKVISSIRGIGYQLTIKPVDA
jgi:DNA-binding response OmpR family regulator